MESDACTRVSSNAEASGSGRAYDVYSSEPEELRAFLAQLGSLYQRRNGWLSAICLKQNGIHRRDPPKARLGDRHHLFIATTSRKRRGLNREACFTDS